MITALACRRGKRLPRPSVLAYFFFFFLYTYPPSRTGELGKKSGDEGWRSRRWLSAQMPPRIVMFETRSNRTNSVQRTQIKRTVLMLLGRARAHLLRNVPGKVDLPIYITLSLSRQKLRIRSLHAIPQSRPILGRVAAGDRQPLPSTELPDSGPTSAEFAWPTRLRTFTPHLGTRRRTHYVPEATASVGCRVDYKQHGRLINRHLPTMKYAYSQPMAPQIDSGTQRLIRRLSKIVHVSMFSRNRNKELTSCTSQFQK